MGHNTNYTLVLTVTRRGSYFRAHASNGALYANAHGRRELMRIIESQMRSAGQDKATIDGVETTLAQLTEKNNGNG